MDLSNTNIRKLLVANRGEIARRIIRTCKAMGIATAAIYSDPDANAPFVGEADEALYIGPPMTGSSFLAIEKIIALARSIGADAVHPGYGFLSENADFAQACGDAGLIFVGPSPEAIRRMGSKIAAKEIAAAAGVPTVPGFATAGLKAKQIAEHAKAIGFPVLIKASAGGGGKGMRIIHAAVALPEALAAAEREAKSSFGDGALLVERYIESPRHIEIQILGDQHGKLLHLFERECSIQRRYQKIIEEAPSPVVDDDLRARMGAAAVAMGTALNYSNAGTVEFVVDKRGRFYFLEVNTRLQVEHPVTEEITGLDLVRLQIEIAEGSPLRLEQANLRHSGHAIECRVYAEDPANQFLPSTGTLHVWEEACLPGVRWESGVCRGYEVSIYYDPMLAKVIAHAATRAEAARRLDHALAKLRVHGVKTNIAFLRQVLRHPAFLKGELDTHFLERHADALRVVEAPAVTRQHAIAAALWQQAQERAQAPVLAALPSGWRNNRSQAQTVELKAGDIVVRVDYSLRGAHADVVIDSQSSSVAIHAVDSTSITLRIDDCLRSYGVVAAGSLLFVDSPLGGSEFTLLPRFPETTADAVAGGCTAPMPGKVLAVKAAPGDTVSKGDTLVILEAMKMEHTVVAPHDGIIEEIRVEVGQQVAAGEILVVMQASPPA